MHNITNHLPSNHFEGEHTIIGLGGEAYPYDLACIKNPPSRLFVVGDPNALTGGVAVVGPRRATPYGLECARRFASLTAQQGITLFSGGGNGVAADAIEAALEHNGKVVAFLGSGLAKSAAYPKENVALFQKIVDKGGALASIASWDFTALPHLFRERNRVMASLAKAVLIVEAGVPSGTFSMADYALDAGREVLAVPCNIDSPAKGGNLLIAQGAVPIVDDESYLDAISRLFE